MKLPFVKRKKCYSEYTLEVVECEENPFTLIPGANVRAEGSHLKFACATKSLLEVTAIATDGNKATVKYKRSIDLDGPLLDKLKACELEKPEEGVEEKTTEFIRSDEGVWSLKD